MLQRLLRGFCGPLIEFLMHFWIDFERLATLGKVQQRCMFSPFLDSGSQKSDHNWLVILIFPKMWQMHLHNGVDYFSHRTRLAVNFLSFDK